MSLVAYKIRKAGLDVKRQVELPVIYDEINLNKNLRLDLLVENLVIVEIKSVDKVNPVWNTQIISHLKLTSNELGFIVNFNVPLIKNEIKRFINTK